MHPHVSARVRSWTLPLLLAMVGPSAEAQEPAARLAVDHLVVGAASLDQGIMELRQLTGVTAQRGGVHPGRGTQNALLGLGEGAYLELVAPSGEPDSSGVVAYLSGLTRLSSGGWALGSPDLEATIRRLVEAGFTVRGPIPGSRRLPDGTVLRWATAHVSGDRSGLAPFFIQWDPGSTHPATSAPGGCRLVSVRLAAPHPDNLRMLLAIVGASAVVERASRSSMRFTLACPAGQVELTE